MDCSGQTHTILAVNFIYIARLNTLSQILCIVSMKTQILNLAAIYRLMDGMHTLDGVTGLRYNLPDVGIDLIGTLKNLGMSTPVSHDTNDHFNHYSIILLD